MTIELGRSLGIDHGHSGWRLDEISEYCIFRSWRSSSAVPRFYPANKGDADVAASGSNTPRPPLLQCLCPVSGTKTAVTGLTFDVTNFSGLAF